MRKFVLLLFAVLASGSLMAQNGQITGRITSADGSPLAGVVVIVQGTQTMCLSNQSGDYTISAPSGAILEFSYLGMKPASTPVDGRSTVDITLQTDTTRIDEVVVTGYAAIRKSAFTGSASVIGESIVGASNDANFLKSLDGAVPGLKMSSNSGIPGGYAEIHIRGVGSISSGKEPLYVVDGMPVWADKDAMSKASAIYFSPLSNINPADIESVTVLKDATATAIYGARASNGVIVITTKKGKKGTFNVNLDMRVGVNRIAPYTDKYKLIGSEKFIDIWSKAYAEAGGNPAVIASMWDGKTDTDWMKEITRNGAMRDINLSVSGTGSGVSYYSSLGYMKNEGFIIGSGTERYSGRLNLEGRSDIFTYGMNTSYSQSLFDGTPNSSAYTNPVVSVYDSRPFEPVYNEDGSYNTSGYIAGGYNPVALADKVYGDIQRQTISTLNANPYLQLNIGYGLSAKTSLGVSIYGLSEYKYMSSTLNPQGIDNEGMGIQYNVKRTNVTWTNTLNWKYTFGGKHNVNLLSGHEAQLQRRFTEYYAATYFPIAELRDMATAAKASGNPENETRYARMASLFFNGEYDYDYKYYLSGSFRRDGYSGFGKNNRRGNFWSLGTKWRVSEEEFLKGNRAVTNLAVRASYGTVGNADIGWYAGRGFYELGLNYDARAGMVHTSLVNPGLGWERSNKLNVGFDVGLAGRVDISIDAYREVTRDLLYKKPLSMTTGFPGVLRNIGSMKNTGVEFSVTATPVRTDEFKWTLYFNGTVNRNEVVSLANNNPIEKTYTIMEPGRPYYQFYMKEWAGVDPDNGDPLWYAADGSKTNDYNSAVKRYLGSADPKFYGGLGTSLSWKGIDLALNFSFQTGGKVYNQGHSYDLQTGHYPLGAVTNYVYDNAWTEHNRNTDVPKFVFGSSRFENEASSRFLYSSDFLRLKSLTLGYDIPRAWIEKVFVKSARIYFTADNLFTLKDKGFIGFDPESAPDGVQMWAYPLGRSFSAGLTIGF